MNASKRASEAGDRGPIFHVSGGRICRYLDVDEFPLESSTFRDDGSIRRRINAVHLRALCGDRRHVESSILEMDGPGPFPNDLTPKEMSQMGFNRHAAADSCGLHGLRCRHSRPRYEPSAILCVNSAPKSVLASQPQKRQSPTRSEGLSERADNHVEITSDRHSPPRYCKCNRRTFCCPSINRLHTINGRRNWC